MLINSLTIHNFRNLADARIDFAPATNFIVGRNGHGKTNIVEAISVLSLGRSFRTARAKDVIAWSAESGSTFADVHDRNGDFQIGLALLGNTREAFINGDKLASLSEMIGRLVCISFSPFDISLIKGAPADRRAFIDKHLVDLQPSILKKMMAYTKAIRSKNILLKSMRATLDQLDVWNAIIADEVADLQAVRRNFIMALSEQASAIHKRLAPRELRLELKSNLIKNGALLKRDEIADLLLQNREAELASRSCAIGSHRDELLITLDEKDARAFASQGEARTIVLALKLAIIEMIESSRTTSPVVLFDDVDSELDTNRSRAFFDLIFERERQVFVTATELPRHLAPERRDYSLIEVRDGVAFKQ